MEKNKPCPSRGASGDEQLWAVHVQGPDDLIAMTCRAMAEQHAAEINTLHEAQSLGREGALPKIRAVVVPSPWSALEHWRHCAETQEQWIQELESRLRSSAARDVPRAVLVPDDDQMGLAWYGPEYERGKTAIPGQVRDYTVKLLGSLPVRTLGGTITSPAVRTSPKTELLALSIRRALTPDTCENSPASGSTDLGKCAPQPVHLREVVRLLRQWGVVDKVEIHPDQLANDEMCNQDFQAAQMASAFDVSHPIDVWRTAYAAALNRCSL